MRDFDWEKYQCLKKKDLGIRLVNIYPQNFGGIIRCYGMDFQLSYLFPSNYEIIGRYSFQKAERDLPAIVYRDYDQFSLGLTRYIWEHALKLQLEGTYTLQEMPGFDSFGSWYGRFQVEIGI
ncbi:MAG: hypothetical protein LAT80_15355 [Balneolaceae bacterium]|nr:hypothetical protein [Balneolaceae bacterium]